MSETYTRFTPNRKLIHCSVDVLLAKGALGHAYALGVVQDIEKNRPDLARRIAEGEPVTVTYDGKEIVIQQPATIGRANV
jgi:hypothetical protein